MKNGNLVIALIIGGVIGFVIGKSVPGSSSNNTPTTVADNNNGTANAGSQGDSANAIYKIPIGDAPVRGPADAKITIVEYSDFQCPFCGRAEGTMKQILQQYGNQVRIAYKENPLPFHQYAQEAAEAAMAANAQGKFWQMHDKMFENQTHLTRADLEKYAQEIGLDMAKFKADLDSHKYAAQIDADKAEARRFLANGTPHFFIDGHRIRGAVPFEQFKAVIDQDLAKANQLIASGTPASQVYEAMTRNGLDHATAPKPSAQPNRPRPAEPTVAAIHEKDIGDAPGRGSKHAKVTIVEWSDFQCPFCGRATPTVEEILKTYGNEVRFYFKNEPLPFHPNAMPAAIAAEAAKNQGKFWEMYKKLFDNQRDLSSANYDKWAGEIGLNMEKFKADIANPATKSHVEADSQEGSRFGANGTPTFFIDGRIVSGAQPFEQFKTVIDEEIKKADALLAKGTPHSELYDKLVDANVASAPKAPSRAMMPADDGKPVNIAIGHSPVTGNPHAPVTMVVFSDFQCPFCGRAYTTEKAILEKYKGKIKEVWKNQPLPFHPNARPAAIAAMAAGKQGKFWEMHDKLFENQRDLSPDNYIKWAGEIGLNVDKFKADMASPAIAEEIDADSKLGTSVGANGTPTFFINGHRLVGAQPESSFDSMIDQALKK